MKPFYILNWKMYLSHQEGLDWITRYGKRFEAISTKASLILCPPLTLLATGAALIPKHLLWGAQDCSAHQSGPFTGDCSAQSIKEAGARFCLVGHSERRITCSETPEIVIQKTIQLIKVGITPIICLGSNALNELPILLSKLDGFQLQTLLIAYEPESAIGSDEVPEPQKIEAVCLKIKKYADEFLPSTKTAVLYGGNVNPVSIKSIAKIPILDGFLLGRSSTDFQVLEKIVLLAQT